MKIIGFLALLSLTCMISACNNGVIKDVTLGSGSRNEVKDVTIGSNIGNSSYPTTESLAHSSLRVYCQVESSGNPVVMGHMGSNDKGFMRLVTGTEYYGSEYSLQNRCDQIVFKTNLGISLGATGWKAAIKNGMPVICAATGDKLNSKCIKYKNGQVLEVATFKKGTNVVKLAEQFEVLTSSASVSVGSGIIDNTPSYYMDFKKALFQK